jgi:alpha-D-ribose 1-methylphosphonate 5-triphosphate synthase subunit PhnI
MGYIAVRGGTRAIEASIERLKYERLRRGAGPSRKSIEAGMRALVDQVMSESSLYSEEVAAAAIRQAEGSPEEAVFLMRAFRSTLPRLRYSLEARSEDMRIERRISASFKDIPGGQILGPSCDYTHRLISLEEETEEEARAWVEGYLAAPGGAAPAERLPKVADYLRAEGLMKSFPPSDEEPKDVTKSAIEFPTRRSERLQILTRGQTGAVTALGYASLRGYGVLHPTVAELRVGYLPILVPDPSGGDEEDAYYVGEAKVTEVETLVPVQVRAGRGRSEIEFELGYGIAFGQNETKAIAMSVLDQGLESEQKKYATQDEEFVLLHVDSVEATGFVSHLKLPHYVTFQSKLDSVRKAKEAAG